VGLDNAPLQVLPRRHRDALIPHCALTQTGIPAALLPETAPVPLPVGAGGAVIFHPLTPHGSLPNASDRFRWSFDIRFNRSGEPTGRSHFPDFVARSRADPGSELRSPDTWREMWQAARARLATAPHIPIHRWDSSAPYCA
jgi:ectoine hydroxylase-related dioxygenase (phytanoyl-CoA dioxygenase family)